MQVALCAVGLEGCSCLTNERTAETFVLFPVVKNAQIIMPPVCTTVHFFTSPEFSAMDAFHI
jgi:hypothetical protein